MNYMLWPKSKRIDVHRNIAGVLVIRQTHETRTTPYRRSSKHGLPRKGSYFPIMLSSYWLAEVSEILIIPFFGIWQVYPYLYIQALREIQQQHHSHWCYSKYTSAHIHTYGERDRESKSAERREQPFGNFERKRRAPESNIGILCPTHLVSFFILLRFHLLHLSLSPLSLFLLMAGTLSAFHLA